SGDTGFESVAAATAGALYDSLVGDERDDLPALAAVMHSCVTSIVRTRTPQARAARHRQEQFWRAVDYVHATLVDPDLSPERVARQLGTSLRYLQQLFTDNGE